MPVIYNGQQSLLEQYAINGFGTWQGRGSLLAQNTYKVGAKGTDEYWSNHTRALADQTTPDYGKGTGGFLDINNYNAGADWDINGNQAIAVGSGRKPAFSLNAATFGYDPTHNYVSPNTAQNIGQVVIK